MRVVHIVDDDEPFRNSLRGLLTAQPDLIVRCFKSGDAFLEQVADLDAGVLLLDLDMPGRGGMEVLTEIGGGEARFATIILTGQADVDGAVLAMQAGACDFLAKPCEPAKLLRVLDRAFSQIERCSHAAQRARVARAKITALSPREGDVLKGLMQGYPNKAIANALELSPRTVEVHRANMMEKLSARSLPDALRVAFTAGLFVNE